ncbi:hypothetical protein [Bifidobacterium sp. SO1]|uniref:hypothetical protein n=1 Tax=Bifidobacterium sp. SO1 TaxID=2809029 RepID=UPI001BDC1E98|nr:hypothetical protein [Bifidobacterium sp. SO1]MBT1161736.1 hypothetical protein [Bifidobacterium sp. SO1]
MTGHLQLMVAGFLCAWICQRLAVPFADYAAASRRTRGRVETFIWDLLYYLTILLIGFSLLLGCIGMLLTFTGLLTLP